MAHFAILKPLREKSLFRFYLCKLYRFAEMPSGGEPMIQTQLKFTKHGV